MYSISYDTVLARISSANSPKLLMTYAKNIERSVHYKRIETSFLKLAEMARLKSNRMSLAEKLPSVDNLSELDVIAKKKIAEASALLGHKSFTGRMIQMIKRYGFAGSQIHLVRKRGVGKGNFHKLCSLGRADLTAEHFVHQYGSHLVDGEVLNDCVSALSEVNAVPQVSC